VLTEDAPRLDNKTRDIYRIMTGSLLVAMQDLGRLTWRWEGSSSISFTASSKVLE
jgi:hypothetical protein